MEDEQASNKRQRVAEDGKQEPMEDDGKWEYIFVPGRVCLFGEHSDWSGGFRRFNPDIALGRNLVVGTNQGLYARVRQHNSALVLSSTNEHGVTSHHQTIPMTAQALLAEAQAGGFWSYVAGVAYKILTDFRVTGLEIQNYRTTLPLKKGLSSSAAVCVLTARSFSRVYGLKMTIRGEMEYAYQGEILTPSRCGRMDQACAFGHTPVGLTYDGELITTEPVVVSKPVHLVVVDLCAEKDTVVILKELQAGFPFPKTDIDKGMHRLLGDINLDITTRAMKMLETGDAAGLGALMTEAMAAFDKYAGAACPSQLTAPVLHRVLDDPDILPLVYGGKGVGAGGDGTAQFVCKGYEEQQKLVTMINDKGMFGMALTVEAASPVRKAVIPCAGFMKELYPASKALKPQLFPIVDDDGVAKPAILIVVEELLRHDMEEVYIIVQQEDLEPLSRLFTEKPEAENFHKLRSEQQSETERILHIGKQLRFIVQIHQDGLGDAVSCARDHIRNEPFLLVLGDHLYKTHAEAPPCVDQLLKAYTHYGHSVVGLQRTTLEDVGSYGAATGAWVKRGSQASPDLMISTVYEKPTKEYADKNLRVPSVDGKNGSDAACFMSFFGMYVLENEIFGYLEDMKRSNQRQHGLFQLTPAIERLRKEKGLVGVPVRGTRYDLGTPASFIQTMQEFAKR